jgi:hypothetical protein
MIGLTPSQKGAAAEAAITSAVIQLGLTVSRPLCEGRRYDLIVDLEPRLLRVQCKLARLRGGVLAVHLQTSRHTPGGYVFSCYTSAEIDAVVAYSAELKRCFLLPIAAVAERRAIHLRIEPSRNNQSRRIKWAEDYDLGSMIERLQACRNARKLDFPDHVSGL